jgi:hypothetical protein
METFMPVHQRRAFLASGLALAAAGHLAVQADDLRGQRPVQDAAAKVEFPRRRIPVSFIIDDSTCLVNMGHFCMPQFQACYPDRPAYQKPWHTYPREIPDAFVREFGEWCAQQGVKGKYSVVPYPACVGWLDRELPGWSRKSLQASLELIRTLLLPNWDVHPEMITHTRVIDLQTGRPLEEISPATMENSYPQQAQSADQLAEYLAYALRILRNCGLPCEGVTTPGGFGNRVKPELSLAVQQAVRDVFRAPIPHFFKYVVDGDASTEPVVEHVTGLGTDGLNLTVNIPAGTGDWFGGWEGDVLPEPDRYALADASGGRVVDLIERGQPALFLCHWPGMYCNGTKAGFRAFQRVVTSISGKYADRIVWLKLSEIARYWAAKELTAIRREGRVWTLQAPFACPDFTLTLPRAAVDAGDSPTIVHQGQPLELEPATRATQLVGGRWHAGDGKVTVCFALPQGSTEVRV